MKSRPPKPPSFVNPTPSAWSRRDFVRAAGAGAIVAPVVAGCATGLTPGRVAAAPAAATRTPDNRHLRIGIVGCGSRGSGAVVQALRADKNSTLVAMGDLFADRLEKGLGSVTSAMGEAAA